MAQTRPRKKKKRNPLYAPFSFIVICAALAFGMGVFFRVSKIEVIGNSIYSTEEIISASGVEEGDNLFLVNNFKVISKIFSGLPYIGEASVRRSLPNKIVIEVDESGAIAYVTLENERWLINRSCKLLEKAKSSETEGLMKINGLTPISPSLGEIIAPGEAESHKVVYLSKILTEIEERGIMRDITEIDMSNVTNPSFDYLGRFTVKMGKDENVDYKFELLMNAVSKLAAGDAGTIDLSIDKKAHFSPN